ncbi:MAG: methenyltetrahydromethanopterin cyclohydrolase [Planctomycetia bacterium]|nr:methenyltetrahydromethanopterin cyclohydrolase [Planctomycetia bacterium]
MNWELNSRAVQLAETLLPSAETLRITVHEVPGGGRVLDCGVSAEGGLGAGLAVAQVCTAGLAEISLTGGEIAGRGWPHVLVASDHAVPACLFSQYAGWQIGVEKFFAMGSGPMRAAAAREEVFKRLDYREAASATVGVLEGRKLPTPAVFQFIAEKTGVSPKDTTLLIAPTASAAGNFQVVARVIETALHKLFEVGFDVTRIRSAVGTAPLAPVARDDLTGIGRTNDAILYGGRVTLWVRGDDESIAEIGPKVPSISAACYGEPFLKIFEKAGHDFYKIDPHLFSPAEIVFQNLDTGTVQAFGKTAPHLLQVSFGI